MYDRASDRYFWSSLDFQAMEGSPATGTCGTALARWIFSVAECAPSLAEAVSTILGLGLPRVVALTAPTSVAAFAPISRSVSERYLGARQDDHHIAFTHKDADGGHGVIPPRTPFLPGPFL